MSENQPKEKGLMGSIFITYFVLILHAVLIILLGLAVVFFRGVVEYMVWIVLGGLLLVGLSGFLFFRRLRQTNRSLRDVINDPAFKGRSLEISFLGGLASVRVGSPGNGHPALERDISQEVHQLEDPETLRVRDLDRVARMLESNLITQQEFEQLKREIMQRGNQRTLTIDARPPLH
ncbi:hypothetical protein DESUT3_04880 [Desulfuromonas versatilis]|uniref:SHOCT domain-containing protein n=1 Tax=Desulfuromonas versatilis TaxID=2802975 RepID=A0ABN6DU48_9BACT|nr:hypothetical protein [Desulfuromonas versatilis]BCR03419.1 hypothetical protein DESUT3_04880 [Desulfuromonas versatilis]